MACTNSPVSPCFPCMSEMFLNTNTHHLAQRNPPPKCTHLRSRLPVLTHVSKRFSAAEQLAFYRTLKLSTDDAGA